MFRKMISLLVIAIPGLLISFLLMSFHLVRTCNGLHLIPKESFTIKDSYVDTRSWRQEDPFQHPELMRAMVRDGMEQLVAEFVQPANDGAKAKIEGSKVCRKRKDPEIKQRISQLTSQTWEKIKSKFL